MKAHVATPLLLQYSDTLDTSLLCGLLKVRKRTSWTRWTSEYDFRAPHNPSVVGSIPTGPTNYPKIIANSLLVLMSERLATCQVSRCS
jgi:hypothetical protein